MNSPWLNGRSVNIQGVFGGSWETTLSLAYNSLWIHQEFPGVTVGRQLSAWGCFSKQQILHLHILLHIVYSPSCKTTHPSPPPFHKGNEGFLWKLQPKYPSVYAEPDDLEAMQINSVLIWMLPEIRDGGGKGTVYTGLFLCNRSPHPTPSPSVVSCHSLAPCPMKNNPSSCCSFYSDL